LSILNLPLTVGGMKSCRLRAISYQVTTTFDTSCTAWIRLFTGN